MTGTPRFLTARQLAERWGLSTNTLSNWRVAGSGPGFIKPAGKPKARVLYRLEVIEAWEREHSYSNTSQAMEAQP